MQYCIKRETIFSLFMEAIKEESIPAKLSYTSLEGRTVFDLSQNLDTFMLRNFLEFMCRI